METRVRHFLSNTCSTKINLLHAFACNHFAKRVLSLISVGLKAAPESTCACALRIIFIDSEEKPLLLLTSGLKYLSRDKITLKCACDKEETVKRTLKQHVLGKF